MSRKACNKVNGRGAKKSRSLSDLLNSNDVIGEIGDVDGALKVCEALFGLGESAEQESSTRPKVNGEPAMAGRKEGELRAVLDEFVSTFCGYGTLKESLWLIGPEEGGGRTASELIARLDAWSALGSKPVVDLGEFHELLGVMKYVTQPGAHIQPTWGKLTRLVLASRGESATEKAVREYQATKLGRVGGDTLLGELMPLPKSKLKAWPYEVFCGDVPYLATKDAYGEAITPRRIELWQELIAEHHPETVVLYGRNQRTSWEKISGVQFARWGKEPEIIWSNGVRYVFINHPNTRRIDNAYFIEAGRMLAGDISR